MKTKVIPEQATAQGVDVKMSNKTDKKHKHTQLKWLISSTLFFVLLNVLAWKSTPFCDFYQKNIFPLWAQTYGRATSVLPFSFGELLIAIAVFGIPISLLVMIVLLIIKKGRRGKVARVFGFIYGWILVFILGTETLNCFVLYHTSSFEKLNGISTEEHTNEELKELGFRIVVQINQLSTQVHRDEDGHFILTSDTDDTARVAIEDLEDEFVCFGGYVVHPKPIYCSFFMSQMDLMGIYFPFSMEANYNADMYKAKLPNTICHELAHTKGFMREEEANYIAFVACDRCDDVEYRYSGYLSALTYVRNKIFEFCDEETKYEFDNAICDEVWADIDGNREYWESVEEAEDTVFESESVSEVSEKAMETSLHANGVEDGIASYGRMVDLMLNYYGEHKFVGEE
ncbi:MAG: DUF3810 domain-containing protein [Ruminococcus sp.]|uniref:DUF3810 domain-containing protein n=1 Tax=Ruminococcus sp. TaxID=41978 RepID=UPI0025ECFB38|nr:DUF3810 domain-containing protein [Ruminococcus sp.]MBO4867516.1 DUF3810 domain-containing protein [Ruminococcus sp.]